MSNSPLPLIRVDMNSHGYWDVASSDPESHDTFQTLDDARRVAFRRAAHTKRYELVVFDAYHRVVQHEVLEEPGQD
jgi:hypothetical protein